MIKERFHSLDSLRGLASLQVVIAHCLMTIPALNWMVYQHGIPKVHDLEFHFIYSPLHFFWNSTPAVKVFFVLSGFVLSLPYYSESKDPLYTKFFIKRIIRLYIPCLAIILISLILKSILFKPNYVSEYGDWVKMMWTKDYTFGELIKLFTLNLKSVTINPALWTIAPEIKLSLILPLFILFQRKLNLLWSVLSTLLILAMVTILNKIGLRSIWSDFNIFYYLIFFLAGSILCKYRNHVVDWINRLNGIQYTLFVIITLYIYSYSYSLWWLTVPAKVLLLAERFADYISGIASIFLIIIALSQPAKKLLNAKFLIFLGKISFSIYLIHSVLIVVLIYLLKAYLSPYVIAVISFIASFPVAMLFYYCVEVPSLNWANQFSAYVVKRFNLT